MKKELKVELETEIKAGSNVVWDALVNPEKVKIYLFGTDLVSEWKIGGRITFQGEYQGIKYVDGGIIKDLDNEKKLSYTYWSSMSGLEDIEENYSLVTFELEGDSNRCRLKVRQEGFASDEARNHGQNGWEAALNLIKEISEKN